MAENESFTIEFGLNSWNVTDAKTSLPKNIKNESIFIRRQNILGQSDHSYNLSIPNINSYSLLKNVWSTWTNVNNTYKYYLYWDPPVGIAYNTQYTIFWFTGNGVCVNILKKIIIDNI